MTVVVVYSLEIIHIYHKQRALNALAQHGVNSILGIGAVPKPRKRVLIGAAFHFRNLLNLSVKPVRKALVQILKL